ncbi:hypothetical protein GCM10028806_28150 [Spirosoma terrae]|uniref:DNA-binding protein n=1 Tax=Spirosoma terrae TaxID=1968276 RepID=A0A6L9LCW8_9BACT|nr:hypothetical protein [Spirosoma terrae]NDU97222.1 hypothetical protein [Spirosoma terrae]
MVGQKLDVSPENGVQTGHPLANRLMHAFNGIPKAFRILARRDFCEYWGCSDDTFRAKRSGQPGYLVTVAECEWLEKYKPVIVRD